MVEEHISQATAEACPCTVIPLRGLRPLQEGVGEWLATSADPQFDVVMDPRWAGHWVKLRFEIDARAHLTVSPVLYLDCSGATGNSVAICLPRPTSGAGTVEYVFSLPLQTFRMRLAPMCQPGRFKLRALSVRRLPKAVAAIFIMLAIGKESGSRTILSAASGFLLPLPRPDGVRQFARWLVGKYRARPSNESYADWIAHFEPPAHAYASLLQNEKVWSRRPLISVLMPVYNTPLNVLRESIKSVLEQLYGEWELCIADDASTEPHVRRLLEEVARQTPRVRLALREHNGHIAAASNTALGLATGDYIALLDHDDLLHPLALHFVAEALARKPDAALVYTDEDKLDETGRRVDPYFKCEFNYELMLAQNMVSHLGVYKRTLVEDVGGFRPGFEGSQDYDLALRIIEKLRSDQIVHLPRVLYHWRMVKGSTALGSEEKPYATKAAMAAVREHLVRIGRRGDVTPAPDAPDYRRVRWTLPSPQPSISIIIPTRDRADLLAACIDSILARTTYRNFEILIIDNQSHEAATMALFERLAGLRTRVLRDDADFNFARLNNCAVKHTDSEYLCLLNNDIEVVTPGWLEELLSFAAVDEIGPVGARLWYPGGMLQHGGVVLGVGGIASHAHKGLRRSDRGYFARAVLHQSFSAVTGACLMVRRSTYDLLQGMDESLAVAFNDVDFCLRAQLAGYRSVWTPYAELVHHESASRGKDMDPTKRARLLQEASIMRSRWGDLLLLDPAYSPNLTLESENFELAWPPRIEFAMAPKAD